MTLFLNIEYSMLSYGVLNIVRLVANLKRYGGKVEAEGIAYHATSRNAFESIKTNGLHRKNKVGIYFYRSLEELQAERRSHQVCLKKAK